MKRIISCLLLIVLALSIIPSWIIPTNKASAADSSWTLAITSSCANPTQVYGDYMNHRKYVAYGDQVYLYIESSDNNWDTYDHSRSFTYNCQAKVPYDSHMQYRVEMWETLSDGSNTMVASFDDIMSMSNAAAKVSDSVPWSSNVSIKVFYRPAFNVDYQIGPDFYSESTDHAIVYANGQYFAQFLDLRSCPQNNCWSSYSMVAIGGDLNPSGTITGTSSSLSGPPGSLNVSSGGDATVVMQGPLYNDYSRVTVWSRLINSSWGVTNIDDGAWNYNTAAYNGRPHSTIDGVLLESPTGYHMYSAQATRWGGDQTIYGLIGTTEVNHLQVTIEPNSSMDMSKIQVIGWITPTVIRVGNRIYTSFVKDTDYTVRLFYQDYDPSTGNLSPIVDGSDGKFPLADLQSSYSNMSGEAFKYNGAGFSYVILGSPSAGPAGYIDTTNGGNIMYMYDSSPMTYKEADSNGNIKFSVPLPSQAIFPTAPTYGSNAFLPPQYAVSLNGNYAVIASPDPIGGGTYYTIVNRTNGTIFKQERTYSTKAIGSIVASRNPGDPAHAMFMECYQSSDQCHFLRIDLPASPVLNLDPQGTIYVSAVAGRTGFSLAGNVGDPSSGPVTVSATVAGKYKSVVIYGSSTASPQNFTLSWDVIGDGIPEGTYSGIVVTATGPGGADSKTSSLVVVVDKTAPQITSYTIASNGYNPAYSKIGDQVSINFGANEPIAYARSTIGSAVTSIWATSDRTFTSSKVMDSSDVSGVQQFTVIVTDLAGNTTTKSNLTMGTDGKVETFYKTSPTLTVKIFSKDPSSGALSNYSKPGSVIQLQMTSNADLRYAPSVTIWGRSATLISSNATSALYNVTALVTDPQGYVPFSVSNIVDVPGNVAANITSTTDGSWVYHYPLRPVIDPVTTTSNNALNPATRAKVGDTVTLTYEADRTITSSATINSTPVTVTHTTVTVGGITKERYTASKQITSSDAEGPLTFRIYNMKDVAGNPIPDVTAITQGQLVQVDKTPPVFSSVSMASSSGDSSASDGDQITLSMVASEQLYSPPTVSINGVLVPATTSDGLVFKAVYTVSSGLQPGQAIPFLITGYKDMAGNQGQDVTTTTDGSSLTYGGSQPQVSSATISSSGPQPNKASAGDTVTVTIVTDRALTATPVAQISGRAAQVTQVNPTTYQASIAMLGSDPEGVVAYQISNIVSYSGRYQTVTSTTDGSYVTFTRSTVSVTSSSLTSSSPHVKTGDTVHLVFTVSAKLKQDPIVLIGSGFETPMVSADGLTYTADHVITNEDSDGAMAVVISGLYDIYGVKGNDYTRTFPVPEVDNTPVTVGNVTVSGGSEVGDTATITFETSEPLAHLPTVTVDGTSEVVQSSGTNEYYVEVPITESNQGKYVVVDINDLEDQAGNTSSSTVTLPLGSSDSGSSGGSGSILINVSGVTQGGVYSQSAIPTYSASSLASTTVIVSATLDGVDFVSGKPVTTKGNHTLVVTARDDEGNTGSLTLTFIIN